MTITVSEEHVALGDAVREFRLRLRLSQEALGDAAGIHRNYVGAVERGEINPTFATLMKLSAGVRLPLSELIAWAEQRPQRLP